MSFVWGTSSGSLTNETTGQTMTGIGVFYFDLASLTPGTTYYYRVKAVSEDPSYGVEMSFTTATTPPSVVTNDAVQVAPTSARLGGNLASMGTAGSVAVLFEWGTTASYGNTTTAQVETAVGAFSANLTGLTANTTYYYRVKAVGDGPAVYGGDMTFTTAKLPDTTAPTITLVASSGITKAGATITWTSDDPATSQVEYGLTEECGSSTTLDTNLVKSHSVDLTGLKAGKIYHYRVISKDASNNETVSADDTFATAARSGGTPGWVLVLIGLMAAAQIGGAVYFERAETAQDTLVRRLDEVVGRLNLMEREKNEATAKELSLEGEVNELRNLISLAESKTDEMLKGGPVPDLSKGQLAPKAPATGAPAGMERV
jgi:phosphodiesterase/alkaline phosphatase D-like protein